MCVLGNYQAGFQKQKAFPNIEDIYIEFRGWQALLQNRGNYGLQAAGTRSTWPSKIKFASRMAGFA